MKKFVSIKWKFLAACIIFLTLPAAILGVLIYQTYNHAAFEDICNDLVLIANSGRTTADIYHEELQRILKREQVLVEKRLESVALDAARMIEFLDEASNGGPEASRFQALVDKLAGIKVSRSGHVFIIDGKGNYILSRGRQFDGMSAIDTQQEGLREEYKNALAGFRKLKSGEVSVWHSRWADPGQPDQRMQVAAVVYLAKQDLLVGVSEHDTDFKSYELERVLTEELKERLARQSIGENGYIFVLDGKGKFIVSKDRLRDGESVLDYRDEKGVYFLRALLAQAKALPAGKTLIARYSWIDLGDRLPQRKIAAVAYHPGLDWVIGASAYEKDFWRSLAEIRWHIIGVCLGFVILGTLVALFFAEHISRPIRQLEGIAVKGDLSIPMDPGILASRDEIGGLAKAFERMRGALLEKINEIERSRMELVSKNEELRRTQEQLVQSEKLAAIGQLAAGVAHEINNPLGYVMSNMETLEHYIKAYEEVIIDIEKFVQRQSDWQSLEDVRVDLTMYAARMGEERFEQIRGDIYSMMSELQAGLSRVKRIVMDLKTFARSEYEETVEIRVEDILEQVITIVWAEIRSKSDLIRDYGSTPPVKCQAQRISQVFTNILVNAAQAMGAGRGLIQVRTYSEGDWVGVDIIDNGEGIRQEHMSKVFDPFFTTKPVGQGAGLGLSISYEIVKRHGGEIRVTSDPGRKTVFTVLLPVKREALSEV